jgi:hypothetical protein
VQSKFSAMSIAPEIIPKKYGQYLAKLFKERQIADYELYADFTEKMLMNIFQWWKIL